MKIDVEEIGPVERKLRIELPATDVDVAFDRVYRDLGKGSKIRGFRPGKAPRPVLEKYFADRAGHEVLQRVVQDSLPKALKESGLLFVGDPRVEPGEEPKQGAAFSYGVGLDIRPEIELKQVKGLKIQTPEVPTPEKDPVEEHFEQLRNNQAQLVEEASDVTAATGHVAVIDFEGSIDGVVFDGGTGHEAMFELGSGRAIPGFEENLEGLAVGAEHEFEVDFPAEYPSPEVAGKHATFKVKLLGLKRKELPELDDEFAKDVSDKETIQDLRDEFQARVDESRTNELKRMKREAVVAELLAQNEFPIPERFVEVQLSQRLMRAASQFGKQIPAQELSKMIENWREEWRPMIEKEVRLAFLAPLIAEAESISVSDEAIDDQLRQIAERQGESLSQVKRNYREQGHLEGLRAALLEDQVVEFLMTEATLSSS